MAAVPDAIDGHSWIDEVTICYTTRHIAMFVKPSTIAVLYGALEHAYNVQVSIVDVSPPFFTPGPTFGYWL